MRQLEPAAWLSQDTAYIQIHVSMEILGRKANGRFFLSYEHTKSEDKAVDFLLIPQKNFLWFLYLKKKRKKKKKQAAF